MAEKARLYGGFLGQASECEGDEGATADGSLQAGDERALRARGADGSRWRTGRIPAGVPLRRRRRPPRTRSPPRAGWRPTASSARSTSSARTSPIPARPTGWPTRTSRWLPAYTHRRTSRSTSPTSRSTSRATARAGACNGSRKRSRPARSSRSGPSRSRAPTGSSTRCSRWRATAARWRRRCRQTSVAARRTRERLVEAGVPIRLVKGAYVETPALAHAWGDATDIAFIELAYTLHACRRHALARARTTR